MAPALTSIVKFLDPTPFDGDYLAKLRARDGERTVGYRSFVESLRDPLDSEYPAGRKLSEILLAPALPLLAPGVRVIAVPDRRLSALNLETLPDPADPSRYL